jgi:hypothetical protein
MTRCETFPQRLREYIAPGLTGQRRLLHSENPLAQMQAAYSTGALSQADDAVVD